MDYSKILKTTNHYTNLKPLKQDTVSFGAMKKSKFSDIDLVVVNKFKAPIEKFNSNNDFQKWCLDKIENEYKLKNYSARQEKTTEERNVILSDWINYLDGIDKYNNAEKLLIIDGITTNLKLKNDSIPPLFNENVLDDTIFEIKQKSKENKNYQIDFNKLYSNNLKNKLLNNIDTGWLEIPSKIKDPDNFESNLDKLITLSHKNWCTKSTKADEYLSKGDFHIYLDKGIPKIGVRFINDEVIEFQGERNNGRVPFSYLDILGEHIKDYILSNEKITEIQNAVETKKEIENFEEKLGKPIKNTTFEELLTTLDMFEKYDNDGFLILKSYSQPSEKFFWSDIEIDENKLLKNAKEIKGNANFSNSTVKEFSNLTKIGGNADFRFSNIENLGSLKEINGNANFQFSNVSDLGQLQKIDGKIIPGQNSIIKEFLKNTKRT